MEPTVLKFGQSKRQLGSEKVIFFFFISLHPAFIVTAQLNEPLAFRF